MSAHHATFHYFRSISQHFTVVNSDHFFVRFLSCETREKWLARE